MLLEVHVFSLQIFLQMRPYFPIEVEGKGVSSKLMVKVLICRIQVIKQTCHLKIFKMSHNCPISFSK